MSRCSSPLLEMVDRVSCRSPTLRFSLSWQFHAPRAFPCRLRHKIKSTRILSTWMLTPRQLHALCAFPCPVRRPLVLQTHGASVQHGLSAKARTRPAVPPYRSNPHEHTPTAETPNSMSDNAISVASNKASEGLREENQEIASLCMWAP